MGLGGDVKVSAVSSDQSWALGLAADGPQACAQSVFPTFWIQVEKKVLGDPLVPIPEGRSESSRLV